MNYPFKDSKIPELPLNIERCQQYEIDARPFLFPSFISQRAVFHLGCSKDKWDELFKRVLIFANVAKIENIIFFWDNQSFVYSGLHWTNFYPQYDMNDFDNYLDYNYNNGLGLPMIDTITNTFVCFPSIFNKVIQMFISKPSGDKDSSISMSLPKLSALNPSASFILQERNITLYAHACLAINLCNETNFTVSYIGNLLQLCSAHGIKGAIFHVGSNTKKNWQLSYQIMKNNILSALHNVKDTITTKFILETPAGTGNCLLKDYVSFINFVLDIKSDPEVGKFIEVCVDTCHAFSMGVEPLSLIEEINNNIAPVPVIHFNDSKNEFLSFTDRHARAGLGFIPYPLLENISKYCRDNRIDTIREYATSLSNYEVNY